MATVRIDEKIKEDVSPILSELGISLSEAINMFLHPVQLYKGLPLALRIKGPIELNDGKGSYVCKHGHLHDYSDVDFDELEKDAKSGKEYKKVDDMFTEILED